MTLFTRTAQDIFAPVTEGGTPRGADMAETQVWGTEVERVITAFVSNGGLIYDTKAAMDADAAYSEPRMAWVFGDPTVANNGIYRLNPSVDLWVRAGDLPYSFVRMSDAGTGTANAIQLTSAIPASLSALRIANVFEANTGNVTVSENGSVAKALLTASGNQIAPAGLMAGMLIAYLDTGSSFRLISDQASASIQAAAEAAQAAAEAAAEVASDYADFARNNWALVCTGVGAGTLTDYPLTIDPGSVNNMLVLAGGTVQMVSDGSYSLVDIAGVKNIRINLPVGVPLEVRASNAIPISTPSDGSVTSQKIADKATTYAKLQDISASPRILGRKTTGAGIPEEISTSELRDLFLPAGAVVDSVVGSYAVNADLTAAIPVDDTIPQVGEGTQIISVSITPKSTTNKLRIRFTGQVTAAAVTTAVAAIFINGDTNAIAAQLVAVSTISLAYTVALECEFMPGSTALQTVTVRVGAPSTIRFNGSATARFLGGASAAHLVVEEIKA